MWGCNAKVPAADKTANISVGSRQWSSCRLIARQSGSRNIDQYPRSRVTITVRANGSSALSPTFDAPWFQGPNACANWLALRLSRNCGADRQARSAEAFGVAPSMFGIDAAASRQCCLRQDFQRLCVAVVVKDRFSFPKKSSANIDFSIWRTQPYTPAGNRVTGYLQLPPRPPARRASCIARVRRIGIC